MIASSCLHRITTLVGDVAAFPRSRHTSSCFTYVFPHKGKTANSLTLGTVNRHVYIYIFIYIYVQKGVQSNLAMEKCLNAHFICFMTRYTVCVQQNTRITSIHFDLNGVF